jgi:hypothetical protein
MMNITEVRSAKESKEFLEVPAAIYKEYSEWIRPLDKDINEVFDKSRNKTFRHGFITRWILYDDNKRTIGRIAAFVNRKYKNKGDDVPVGGIGFFECINDREAAELLFETAKKWLSDNGMEAMDGPINFGERDKWWGLLISGFQSPLYCMNYNPPYYQQLFEGYGFQPFFYQYCYGMHTQETLQPKFYERHQKLSADPGFTARHIRKNDLEKAAADFYTIYNKAWAGHAGNKEMSLEMCRKIFSSMKPVMDEKVVWFAYYNEDPIAMFVNLPDLNQWFKYLNGKFGWFEKLRFLWYKATKINKRFLGLAFGVVPEFQAMGVDSFLIVEAAKIIQPQLHYEEYEMMWIGDFNPKMIAVAENLTPVKSRILTTYRYIFDRNKPFHRHPFL